MSFISSRRARLAMVRACPIFAVLIASSWTHAHDNNSLVQAKSDAVPTVSVSDLYVREGDSASNQYVKISLANAPSSGSVTVKIALSSGTATPDNPGADYDPSKTYSSIWLSSSRPSADIQIRVKGDQTEEPDETFGLTISDPTNAILGKSSATITLLNDDGDVPQARTDHFVFNPGTATAIPAVIGVLANDSTFGPGPLNVSLTKTTEHGTLVLASDGSFVYSPAADYRGLDQFVYQVCDQGSGRCARGVASLRVGVTPGTTDVALWTVPPASDQQHQGFLRFSNTTSNPKIVTLYGVDTTGKFAPRPISMTLGQYQSQQVNSQDLETGNAGKGLTGYFGRGTGNWTVIAATSDVPTIDDSGVIPIATGDQQAAVLISSYIRTPEGFLTSVHSRAAGSTPDWIVPTFNPASNTNQVSWLRIVNPNASSAAVTIQGIDDLGVRSSTVATTIPAFSALELTASDLERGNSQKGLLGQMGYGSGKWRLKVSADQTVGVQSLLSDPSGYLTDLSSTLPIPASTLKQHLYYVPRASNTLQQGFVRVTNPLGSSIKVTISGYDDKGALSAGSLSFTLNPGESRQFNSEDLQYGNGSKATGSLGVASGDWRLNVSSDRSGLIVDSYIRTVSGFLTAMHDLVTVRSKSGSYIAIVPLFNPAANTNQVSALRLTNITDAAIDVTIQAKDDAGQSGISAPTVKIPAQATVELTASDLEYGNVAKGLTGSLGSGSGKWRLDVSSPSKFRAVNLLRDPKGYVTNLSTSPTDVWQEQTDIP